MKVCVVSQVFAPQHEGGAEIVARRAAEYLSQIHDVRVFALALAGDEGETLAENSLFPVQRIPYHNLYLPEVRNATSSIYSKFRWHVRNSFGGVRASDLRAALEQFAPDVIYAHNSTAFQPQLGSIAHQMGIPIVAHLHDYSYLCPRTTMYAKTNNCAAPCWKCRLLTTFWRSATQSSVTDAIAVSEFVRSRLQANNVMQGARWHVLPNVEPPQRLASWKRVSTGSEAPYTFGFLGALVPTKGIADLVQAFLSLPKGQARLLIGGRGAESFVSPLRELTAQSDVAWLGHVDANSLLARTDALVVPSLWHEPQALVVTEGVCRNLTVIGSDRGGTTEVLRDYPAGILYDPTQTDGLVAAMKQAMAQRRPHVPPQIAKAQEAWNTYFATLDQILTRAHKQRLA